MQSLSAAAPATPKVSYLCDLILDRWTTDGHAGGEAAQAFSQELLKLRRFLDITERERRVKQPRLPWEDQHSDAMNHLVGRCRNTLASLCELMTGQRGEDLSDSPSKPADAPQWDPSNLAFSALRAHISFYDRTLDMHLKALRL